MGHGSWVIGYRLSVRLRVSRFSTFPLSSFPTPPPSRHFVPFAVKMHWSILRRLRFLWLIIGSRREAKGERREERGERSEVRG